MPLAVLGCVAGTLLTRRSPAGDFDDIQVESELGRADQTAEATSVR
ncbi:hypothetical protein F8568_035700 [Actinomadura sp. LD22]|uniref:Uncharacterized protein n=1 Tax=Actinomadura physcomitrii TaxID=2650748 RepID=A0A6I4MLV8_9ACTN|nr:hypothetical protein [Actinomadura physcomitrii]MWA05615.1 hypothetical protein [Actinomadura physcomitrii]